MKIDILVKMTKNESKWIINIFFIDKWSGPSFKFQDIDLSKELIDNDISCQMFWFKIGWNEFEATYDEWINHNISNFALIKKVVTALKNENCVIISEFITELTPF